jgi:hypothetical protein
MRLGSYYAEGGATRGCGLGDDDALVDLNRADATPLPGEVVRAADSSAAGAAAVI